MHVGIVAKVCIDHVCVNVGIRVKPTSVCRIAETITFLLSVLSQFSSLLAYLLDLLNVVLLLEVSLLNCLDAVFVLQFEGIKFVHSHVHNVITTAWVNQHLR